MAERHYFRNIISVYFFESLSLETAADKVMIHGENSAPSKYEVSLKGNLRSGMKEKVVL